MCIDFCATFMISTDIHLTTHVQPFLPAQKLSSIWVLHFTLSQYSQPLWAFFIKSIPVTIRMHPLWEMFCIKAFYVKCNNSFFFSFLVFFAQRWKHICPQNYLHSYTKRNYLKTNNWKKCWKFKIFGKDFFIKDIRNLNFQFFYETNRRRMEGHIQVTVLIPMISKRRLYSLMRFYFVKTSLKLGHKLHDYVKDTLKMSTIPYPAPSPAPSLL
jgi:hypothetical protein